MVYHCDLLVDCHYLLQAWKPSSQHAGEKRGVAGLFLGRTERADRTAEKAMIKQLTGTDEAAGRRCLSGLHEGNPVGEGTTRRGTATPGHRPQRPVPKVPGRRRGTRGFPAAPRERPRVLHFTSQEVKPRFHWVFPLTAGVRRAMLRGGTSDLMSGIYAVSWAVQRADIQSK